MISEIAIEATPGWLAAAFPPLHEFPIRDILRDSVYYPASGIDGDPVKYLAGNFHSFVLADYGVGRERVLGKLSAFRGYRIAAQREVSERELTPSGWTPQLLQGCKDIPQRRTRRMQPPFGIWSIHERTNEFGSDHGPERFSMLYIGGDGVATFQALYRGNSIAPAVIAIIQPGTGFGGNWTDFEEEEGVLARSVLANPCGAPGYLLYGGWGDGKLYRQSCWPSYSESVGVIHGRLRLWKRSRD